MDNIEHNPAPRLGKRCFVHFITIAPKANRAISRVTIIHKGTTKDST